MIPFFPALLARLVSSRPDSLISWIHTRRARKLELRRLPGSIRSGKRIPGTTCWKSSGLRANTLSSPRNREAAKRGRFLGIIGVGSITTIQCFPLLRTRNDSKGRNRVGCLLANATRFRLDFDSCRSSLEC